MIASRFSIFLLCTCLIFTGAALARGAERTMAGPVTRVAGFVSVVGALERPKPLRVFKSRSFCGPSVPNETLLVSADGRLRNAAVILRALNATVVAQPTKIVLDNQHCAFMPHVQVASLGSELMLKNSDPILHTVHARMGQETLFNVGLPNWRRVTKRLDRTGFIRIDCDVLHTWMSAAILVTDSPYFFVTNDQGEFAFDGIPAGVYDIEIWHEQLGRQSHRITVRDGGATDVDVVFALEKKR